VALGADLFDPVLDVLVQRAAEARAHDLAVEVKPARRLSSGTEVLLVT
jgi:hypothetical protein